MATTTENARNASETPAQNARFVAEQSRVMADEAVEAGRQIFEAYQAMQQAWLQGSFQATNRWFEISRVLLDQAEITSRESKGTLEALAQQARRQQETVQNFANNNARVLENTWLGAYRNGRNA